VSRKEATRGADPIKQVRLQQRKFIPQLCNLKVCCQNKAVGLVERRVNLLCCAEIFAPFPVGSQRHQKNPYFSSFPYR